MTDGGAVYDDFYERPANHSPIDTFNECCCNPEPRWLYAVCFACGSTEWGCSDFGHACHDCFMRMVDADRIVNPGSGRSTPG
jgi:hypothetical protein